MGFLSKILSMRICAEAEKAMDRYVESAFINALLPHADSSGVVAALHVTASVDVVFSETFVEYTEHEKSKDTPASLTVPPRSRHLDIDTIIPAMRPRMFSDSQQITAEDVRLTLESSLKNIGLREMFMGVGATLNNVNVRLTVSGGAVLQWILPQEDKTGQPESAESPENQERA